MQVFVAGWVRHNCQVACSADLSVHHNLAIVLDMAVAVGSLIEGCSLVVVPEHKGPFGIEKLEEVVAPVVSVAPVGSMVAFVVQALH